MYYNSPTVLLSVVNVILLRVRANKTYIDGLSINMVDSSLSLTMR